MRISDWSSDVCSSDLDLRRPRALARLAIARRVAGARLDADVEPHFLDRGEQVALHVDRERLQGRDVERVEAIGGRLDQLDEARQKPSERLPRPGRGDEQGVAPGTRGEPRSEEHTSELQSLMRISYAVFCLKTKTQ